ncbi:TIGR00730 family Rossman fold protein [Pelagicoccus sp. SDUM812003]|uniref:TIGR00730 family Rossman fold protein n=1 Tax=Pelagicoccus sp. SDUM812003 TaxID=3041267 RepID=UPI00280CD84C|nr:TIGR00730 family Rossman fold protein [Pelagicoccus sp. SDUM812003]MDQ8205455.1 TIGR00730 family Rossman fold protein [Pelagicoccus sp. SDUM812003]
MPFVRLSGKISGTKDPSREARARILYLLFANGWDIYNSNGDQQITLSNIERKIVESDAFVFMPGASLEDLFKAVSIFVGYQTLDVHLFGKATVILNSDRSWDSLFELLDSLRELGTIRQNYRKFLLQVNHPQDVLDSLERVDKEGLPDVGREKIMKCHAESFEKDYQGQITRKVCVFCSASIEDVSYLAEGYELGKMLAERGIGCVSGAGTTGVMGAVVRGSVEAGGWTGGSNVPHIIELEGLPEGMTSFWLRPDIYTRMEAMIQNSDAFVIFPGGAGTVQEMLALLIFKQLGSPLMKGKPVVIYNKQLPGGVGFWDHLVRMLDPWKETGYYSVANSLEEVLKLSSD